jgi:tetratricopeptide (TPR) repeat protein
MKLRKLLVLVTISIFTLSGFGQNSEIENLIQQGIKLHDNGNYQEAINLYKKALSINPNSSLANYEIALSYQSEKDYKNAEKFSKKVLEINNDHILPAYIAYANALDMQGESKKAIKAYEKAIKKFDHYLLYFNYGYTCFNRGEIKKAYNAAIKAINNNPSHGSSHLLLSKVMAKKGDRIKAMLPIYFFLLIEPNSARSKIEYQTLRSYIDRGVTRTSEKNIDVIIPMNDDSNFGAVEMMISLAKASNSLKENKDKSDLQLFAKNNETIFNILGELKKDNIGFWWDFYVTLFYDLAKENLTEIYSYYISLSMGEEAVNWVDEHSDDFEKLKHWLE